MSLDEQLSALIAGDLTDAEAEALRRRIAAEPAVATRFAAMQDLTRQLDALPLPIVPDDLARRVVRPPRRSWTPWIAAAAALLVGFGLGRIGGPERTEITVDTEASSLAAATGTIESRLARARADVERLETELALARGRIVTHEGEPVPWPDDLPDPLRPSRFGPAAEAAYDGPGEILAVECQEYPCAVLVHEIRPPGYEGDWDGILAPLAEAIGPPWQSRSIVRTYDRDGELHVFAVVGVLREQDLDAYEGRLLFRARELIDAAQ